MLISYVLRLRSDALAEGLFVGEIEAVVSRQRQRIRNIGEVAAFAYATMPIQVASKETAQAIGIDADSAHGEEPPDGVEDEARQPLRPFADDRRPWSGQR